MRQPFGFSRSSSETDACTPRIVGVSLPSNMRLGSTTGFEMDSYNPDTSPTPTDWLRTDEGDRIELVSAYHRGKKIKLPNAQLHAVIHVVVENQLALGEEPVRIDAGGGRVNWRTVSTVPRTASRAHGQKLARRLTPTGSRRPRVVVRSRCEGASLTWSRWRPDNLADEEIVNEP
jgi:hypothetical protein